MTYLRCLLLYVGVNQLSAAQSSTLSFRIHWCFRRGVNAHSLEGLIQPANYDKGVLYDSRRYICPDSTERCRLILLVVVLVEVVSLIDHLSAGEVQRDLPVLAGGMAEFSKLLLFYPQLLTLTG